MNLSTTFSRNAPTTGSTSSFSPGVKQTGQRPPRGSSRRSRPQTPRSAGNTTLPPSSALMDLKLQALAMDAEDSSHVVDIQVVDSRGSRPTVVLSALADTGATASFIPSKLIPSFAEVVPLDPPIKLFTPFKSVPPFPIRGKVVLRVCSLFDSSRRVNVTFYVCDELDGVFPRLSGSCSVRLDEPY